MLIAKCGMRLFGSEVRSFRENLCDISSAHVTTSFDGSLKAGRANLQGCVIPGRFE